MTRGRKLFVKCTVALAGLSGGLAPLLLLLNIEMALLNDYLRVEPGHVPWNWPWGLVTFGAVIVGMAIGWQIGIGLWGFVATRMKWLTWAEIDEVIEEDRRRMGRKLRVLCG